MSGGVFRTACRRAALAAVFGLLMPALVAPLMAEQAAPMMVQQAAPVAPIAPQQHEAEPPQQQSPDTPRSSDPGFLGALWRFVDESVSNIGAGLKSVPGEGASEATKEAGEAIKDAATSVARLPSTSVVTGRERCQTAGNGGPDCRAAADTVCKAKGFRAGRSLDVQAAERCPAQVYISGRPPAPGECRMETFVTRAVCQ